MNAAIKKAAESPAFARSETDDNYGSEGINTRTYIATKLCAASIASGALEKAHEQGVDPTTNQNALVFTAVQLADALIAELAKS